MTIQFNCPSCDSLIAFDDKHAGKRARCTTCGQIFIIPSKDGEKPKKVKHKVEKAEPDPGFYRAVFVDAWKLFFDPENAASLVFVAAVICFKFFLSPSMCCGYIAFVVVWGWLLGFYLNIIHETAFGIDKLPEIYLGCRPASFHHYTFPARRQRHNIRESLADAHRTLFTPAAAVHSWPLSLSNGDINYSHSTDFYYVKAGLYSAPDIQSACPLHHNRRSACRRLCSLNANSPI